MEKWFSKMRVGFIGLSMVMVFLSGPSTAFAQPGAPVPVIGGPSYAAPVSVTDRSVLTEIEKPFKVAFLQIMWNFFTFISNRIAYDAAVSIATAGTGEGPLVELRSPEQYVKDLGQDVAGQAIGSLSESLEAVNIHFDLCAPSAPFRLAFQLGIKAAYERPEPICDFQEFTNNWQGLIETAQSYDSPSEYILKEYVTAVNPRTADLTAGVQLYSQVFEDANEKESIGLSEFFANDGYNNVADVITGKTDTPADMIQFVYEKQVEAGMSNEQIKSAWQGIMFNSDLWEQLGLSALSVFSNTLLSQLTERLYSGIFDFPIETVDPFDISSISFPGGVEAAERQFRSIIAVNPVSFDTYSVISEFTTCAGTTTRQLNHCVMDPNFGTAVASADGGDPFTIQEAIDEGLVNGSWPLISSVDARNTDQYCYTYGFCYGNLVRMRKARIISVGWEIAADYQKNETTSKTLQQAIDDFDNCNDNNERDPSHPYCHLIDPNWVLKYPSTQCRVSVPGQLVANVGTQRGVECVDAPSCIQEDANGNCIGGYGYCAREKNTWQFRGDDCPSYYATCLSVESEDGDTGDFLLNTVDFDGCDADNAGCLWYQTRQTETDDVFDWPEILDVSTDDNRANAHVDRVYFNNNVETCDSDDAGCRQFIEKVDDRELNLIPNPSFEDDVDGDNQPDVWQSTDWTATEYFEGVGTSGQGGDAISVGAAGSSTIVFMSDLIIQQGIFYTLSFYAAQPDASTSNSMTVYAVLASEDGSEEPDLDGTSYSSDNCSIVDLNADGTPETLEMNVTPASDAFERFTCTFTAPTLDGPGLRMQFLDFIGEDIYLDGVQLEPDEDLSTFRTGYGSSIDNLDPVNFKYPPAYLGCTGEATDPVECSDYVPICSALDVGCELYTPTNGDPAVPGIISDLDQCPSECSGYDTYKQEPTRYEPAGDFPVYFIPSTAISCGEQEVGCDEFTNLNTEALEYYTYLRACLAPDQTTEEANYFTWEGSDLEGFQLHSWVLLQSDLDDAPCTNWVTTADGMECEDVDADSDGSADTDETCDEHDDIFTEPDCREFYDEDGDITYRLFSDTVTITDSCNPYRKTEVVGVDSAEQESNCDGSGGYWDATTGECRFFGFPDESVSCSAAANGCREYTGGAGRNSRVVYTDDVEDADVDEYVVRSATAEVSNESVATDGHSIHVEPTSDGGLIATAIGTLDDCSEADGCDESDGLCDESDGCDTEVGTLGFSCTIPDGNDTCGELTDELAAGKIYVVNFWAKSSTNGTEMVATFLEDAGTGAEDDFDVVELSTAWQEYSLGPLDTSGEAGFDETALLAFMIADLATGADFYVDNVTLRQTEENITVIKDSWETPASCDETEEGDAFPQYHLGCAEYSDSDAETWYLKSFTRLCSEDKIGCSAFFATQESESPYGKAYNLTCENIAGEVSVSTSCQFEGETLCTIQPGSSRCNFDWEGNAPRQSAGELIDPDSASLDITLRADAETVQPDGLQYFVADEAFECDEEAIGCTAVGLPTFGQDGSTVASWTDAALLIRPDSFVDQLCNHPSLFCEAWDTTQDGTFYFKNPGEQKCEYRSGVGLGGTSYSGWFREGTNEFCYGTGSCSDDAGIACTRDAECAAAGAGECDIDTGTYLIAGTESGLWKNGDADYAGWVGACESQYDLCTEFVDPADVGEDNFYGNDAGQSYFFLDNDVLDESNLATSKRCDGKVSQKRGCALFNDAVNSELNYNASASYLESVHASQFVSGASSYDLVDPVSCPDGGSVTTLDGTTYDLCSSRCTYENELLHPYEDYSTASGTDLYTFAGSCIQDSDCPAVTGDGGDLVEGFCRLETFEYDSDGDGSEDTEVTVPALEDDTNTIKKVNLDRACAEWLSCISSTTVWDTATNTYKQVCDDIDMCREYTSLGESTTCSEWSIDQHAFVLSADRYAERDVGWYGFEYAGYSIPNQVQAQFLSQVNVNPARYCVSSTGVVVDGSADGTSLPYVDCTDDDAICTDLNITYSCEPAVEEFRLAHVAGACTQDNGESCTIGFCEDSGVACGTDSDCNTLTGEACRTGNCAYSPKITRPAYRTCSTDADCTGATYNTCVNSVCSQKSSEACDGPAQCTPTGNQDATCLDAAAAQTGECYNDQCLLDVRDEDDPTGEADPFSLGGAEEIECRGWPESDSPFPNQTVELWVNAANPTGQQSSPAWGIESRPFTMKSTFESVNTCVGGEECQCNYEKVSYNNTVLYFDQDSDEIASADYICVGGSFNGALCDEDGVITNDGDATTDVLCEDGGGICTLKSEQQTLIGLEGFCLERDTILNLNGNRTSYACLTWLPVDRLSGSSDIYGKSTEAGYPLEEAYMCGEVSLYMDVPTSQIDVDTGQIACAELEDSDCNDTWDDKLRCDGNAVCPQGMYAIMGRCIIGSSDTFHDGNAAYPGANSSNACRESGATNDCPYVCVPEVAVHTTTGDPCVNPSSNSELFEIKQSDVNYSTGVVTPGSSTGNDVYKMQMEPDIYDAFVAEYEDCVAAGVNYDNGEVEPFSVTQPEDCSYCLDTGGGITTCDSAFCATPVPNYRYLEVEPVVYPACTELAQIATLDGNQAWTDRALFAGRGFSIDPNIVGGGDYGVLKYDINSLIAPLGQATTPDFLNALDDTRPAKVLSCRAAVTIFGFFPATAFVPANPDGTCPAGTLVEGMSSSAPEARTFTQGYGQDEIDASHVILAYTQSDDSAWVDDAGEDPDNIISRITQGFASAFEYFVWSDATAEYGDGVVITSTSLSGADDDVTESGDGGTASDSEPSGPVIRAIGEVCVDQFCREGSDNTFSVNSEDSGTLVGTSGQFLADVKFFVEANPNQMPIRRVLVDWGDDRGISGSITDDNYYKNRRGLNNSNQAFCDDSTASSWGETINACDPTPFNVSHVYTCSEALIQSLITSGNTCVDGDGDGEPDVSPCTGGDYGDVCVYQPRVHVRDNWGWCTGICPGGEDGEDGCYDGDQNISVSDDTDQCDYANLPNGGSWDPWVYFNGVITVEP